MFAVGDEFGVDDQATNVPRLGKPGPDFVLQPFRRAILWLEWDALLLIDIPRQTALADLGPVGADAVENFIRTTCDRIRPQIKVAHPTFVGEQIALVAIQQGYRHRQMTGKLL